MRMVMTILIALLQGTAINVAYSDGPAGAPDAAPTPVHATVVAGVVQSSDGKPVQNAVIVVQPIDPSATEHLVVHTDSAGGFRVSAAFSCPCTIRAEAVGFAPSTVRNVSTGTSLSIKLTRSRTIQGTVRDGLSGASLADVLIEVSDKPRAVLAQGGPAVGSVKTTTDSNGHFRLDGLTSGLHTLTARVRGYTPGERRVTNTDRAVSILLFPSNDLSGWVRDAEGKPLSGVAVRLEDESPLHVAFAQFTMPVADKTDTKGHFEIPGLAPGNYTIVAEVSNYAPRWVSVNVGPVADGEPTITLHRGSYVLGRLIDAKGNLVKGQLTLQATDSRPIPGILSKAFTSDAGPDGRFRFGPLPPGSHVISILGAGFAPKSVMAAVGTSSGAVDVGDIVLEPGLGPHGRVRDRTGLPIAAAEISGWMTGSNGVETHFSARTEPDGSYAVAGLGPGAYRMVARAPGYAEQTKTVEAGTGESDFLLDAAGWITGVAVDDADRPIDSLRISAQMIADRRTSPRVESINTAGGAFVFDNLSAGTYVLELTAPEHARASISRVTVTSGAKVDVGRVRLSRGALLRGTIIDTLGAPIMGASVATFTPGDDAPGGSPETVSDEDGTFELGGLPLIPLQLTVRHQSYAETRLTIDMHSLDESAEQRIVLHEGGRLEGSVRRRGGEAVVGAQVQVIPLDRGASPLSFDNALQTSADGTFTLEHVPAGRVRVALILGSGGQYTSGPSSEAEIRDGETTALSFISRDIVISGRVTRGASAAASIRLRMESQHGGTGRMFFSFSSATALPSSEPSAPRRGEALTGEDGTYALIVDEPGRYSLSAATGDGNTSYPTRIVDVPDIDTLALDVALTGLPVSGSVVDADSDRPIPSATIWATPRPGSAGAAGECGGSTGSDGRFALELEPGDYTLAVRAEGYAEQTSSMAVEASGASDIRVALSRGAIIAGHVFDSAGGGVAGVTVRARPANGEPRYGDYGISLADGSFQIVGLNKRSYNLAAQFDSMFAIGVGISAGQKEVGLTLGPGSRVSLKVRAPDGALVGGAYGRIDTVDGAPVAIGFTSQTNSTGVAELAVPAGRLVLVANKPQLEGHLIVAVQPGESIQAEMTLSQRK